MPCTCNLSHLLIPCLCTFSQVAPPVLLSFGASMNCSRAARPAVELLHISKSGGTSMCQLAAKSGLANPGANMHRNCLVSEGSGKGQAMEWSGRKGANS